MVNSESAGYIEERTITLLTLSDVSGPVSVCTLREAQILSTSGHSGLEVKVVLGHVLGNAQSRDPESIRHDQGAKFHHYESRSLSITEVQETSQGNSKTLAKIGYRHADARHDDGRRRTRSKFLYEEFHKYCRDHPESV